MGFSLGKVFNKVSGFVFHPTAFLNKFLFDATDKGLQKIGVDLFGSKLQ